MNKRPNKLKSKTTLAEKAKKDKESGLGVGRGNKLESTREAFRAWLLLPRNFLGASENILRALGIADSQTVELCSITTQADFAAKFNVMEPTLSRWKREMREGNDFKDFKHSMRGLTKNVMGALYRKAMTDGDAARVKLWLQTVEDWHETLGYQEMHKLYELSDEEKARLDRLIEANCVKM